MNEATMFDSREYKLDGAFLRLSLIEHNDGDFIVLLSFYGNGKQGIRLLTKSKIDEATRTFNQTQRVLRFISNMLGGSDA